MVSRKQKDIYILGENSPWVSPTSACIVTTDSDTLCLELSFQEYLYSEQPWVAAIVSPSGTKTLSSVSFQGKG